MISIKAFDKTKGTISTRELDALMWMLLNDKELNLLTCRYLDGDVRPHAGYPVGHISPAHYSSDTAAVAEVLDKATYFEAETLLNPDGSRGSVVATVALPGTLMGDAEAGTLSLAVCLAALRAKGYQFPEEVEVAV